MVSPTYEEMELRTQHHQHTNAREDISPRHDAGNGRPGDNVIEGSVSNICGCSEDPRVSPRCVAHRSEVGTQVVVDVRDVGSVPVWSERETSQPTPLVTGQLLDEQATHIARGNEPERGRIARSQRRLDGTTKPKVEADKKGDGLQRDDVHDAILQIGEEKSCDKDIELPLQDQVLKLKEEIRKLKIENLPIHLAEAMSDELSSILLQQENQRLKEQVGLLTVQISDYQEDFAAERKDRVKAVENTEKMKDELQLTQNELQLTQNELAKHKDLLEDMETVIGIQTRKCKEMLGESRKALNITRAELEAAKEEIAVKVAQVKQYQKQVEAYKQTAAEHVTKVEVQKEDIETLIIELDKGKTEPINRRKANDDKDIETLIIELDKGKTEPVCRKEANDEEVATGARSLRSVSADQCPDPHHTHDAVLNVVKQDEERSSVGIGSPAGKQRHYFPSPVGVHDTLDSGPSSPAPDSNGSKTAAPIQVPNPSQIPVSSHIPIPNQSIVTSQIPIPSHHTSDQLCVPTCTSPHLGNDFVVGSIDDGSNLPPPILFPPKRLSTIPQEQVCSNWERPSSEPQPSRASHLRRPGYVSEEDLFTAIDEDIHAEAERVMGGGMVASALSNLAPLDPNLQCICCRQMFRKGEIQKFKQHVLGCTGRGHL